MSSTPLPFEVADNETATRFIFHRNGFGTQPPAVKARALEPPEDNRTSVFRIASLVDADVWQLGVMYVEAGRRDRIRAPTSK